MEGTRVSGQGIGGKRFWQLAVFAATGTLGVTSQAEAAIYYWQDSAPAAVAEPAPKAPARHPKTHRLGEKKSAAVEKDSKPQGPLIISISIAQQKLRLYDANGLFAESPVSTGMPGHPTPMGVFSVIQKQKFHRSNIYSGAPMPFMQRITWSGVAMHAGVLPGYPASHGCIRMPAAFAVKMYNWTRMSARVIITPGDVTPASFSHPLLAAIKVGPQAVAVEETKADAAAVQMPERPAQVDAGTAQKTVDADTRLELRSTVGHADMKPAADENHASTSPNVKTADASGALPTTLSANGMSDAAPLSEHGSQPAEASASDKPNSSATATQTDAPKSEIDPAAMKHDEAASAEAKPAGNSPAEAQPAKIADSEAKPAEAAANQPAMPDAAAKPDDKTVATAPAVAPVGPTSMPLKADPKSDFAKMGLPLKKTEQIAVFVSRKDSKLYVRQNLAPLFDVPVKIAADERPLGTHIFTAQVDKSDANVLHWSVVSLPVPAKAANRRAEERMTRSRKVASEGPIEAKALPTPDSPAEALDRLSLPAEVMAKIYEAISTGGSIIISDQGIAAGETGEGTDFIVSLR
ncbi:L,D-transpeptidase family protein [Bradyrhizobium sp.]|jgi:lipoprotein-anchoring transpeptidase ErfK/SrfK|uniref:L,D-transpeptidase n=1 Tax=Bradyrhizobium sp. TaxID=376 RepID=UPI003C16FF97